MQFKFIGFNLINAREILFSAVVKGDFVWYQTYRNPFWNTIAECVRLILIPDKFTDVPDYKCLQEVTPKLIAEEMSEKAPLMYRILNTLLSKPKDEEDESEKRVGVAASVLMNLMNQKMSVYATKIGVSLIAQGKLYQ